MMENELDFETRLVKNEERVKSNSHRLDEIEKRQTDLEDLVSTVKVLAVREARVEEDVREIKNDVKSLTSIPGKRWEQIVTLVIAAIAGFVLAKIGL